MPYSRTKYVIKNEYKYNNTCGKNLIFKKNVNVHFFYPIWLLKLIVGVGVIQCTQIDSVEWHTVLFFDLNKAINLDFAGHIPVFKVFSLYSSDLAKSADNFNSNMNNHLK